MQSRFLKTVILAIVYVFAVIGFVLVAGYFAIRYGLTNEKGVIDTQREAFLGASAASQTITAPVNYLPLWADTEEWRVLEEALRHDAPAINRAAQDAGVSPRLIAANLVAEQLRLFFTEREFYKQFFYPLKILGAQTQFSWGVMGMKESTAIAIEKNLLDPSSPRYLGAGMEHLLDFKTADPKTERFERMTDQHDHYWSYLYAGLYLREVMAEWGAAGFPIDNNVSVLSTLYNIGFNRSNPNPNPNVGGAEMTMNGISYSFGRLANEFYVSNLLSDVLPQR